MLLAALSTGVRGRAAGAPATPVAPTRWVTDQADFLTPATRDALDQRLARFEHDAGHQVLLWIGRTTGGEPIEPWAARAFAAWRVGRKGLDDGVVLFVLADDRKMRIEVGYGLEEKLPDARASRILAETLAPRLRSGDRDGAARAGVEAILAALGAPASPSAPPVPAAGGESPPEVGWGTILLMVLGGLVLAGFLITHPSLALLMLTSIASGRGSGRRGGGWGGGGFGGGGFGGGGGRSGGGGASGSW